MRALLVWELGDNLGHAGKLIRIGEELAKRGVKVFIALQDTLKAAPFLTNPDITLLAAPYGRIRPQRPAGPRQAVLSYADDVALCGYHRPPELAAMIRAWDGLFDLVQPDLLLADSAPTALLAAQARPFVKVVTGMGYSVPPCATPMPPFRYWEPEDMEELQNREARLLSVINAAQAMLGRPPFAAFQDILRSDAQLISTFAELDHYPQRDAGEYVGPFFMSDRGAAVQWHGRQDRKIFAYLYPDRKSFGNALEALKLLRQDVILVAPGIASDLAQPYQSPHLRIHAAPVQLEGLFAQADLSRMSPEDIRAGMAAVLDDPAYRSAAQGFAQKYKDFSTQAQAETYTDRLLSLVEKRAA